MTRPRISEAPEGAAADDAPLPPPARAHAGLRLRERGVEAAELDVAEEVPIAMVYNGVSHAVMIGTPADLEEFGLGFSLSEGILDSPAELLDIDCRPAGPGLEIDMRITTRRFAALAERRRTLAGRTGCGLCGVDSLGQVVRPFPALDGGPVVDPAAIRRALAELPGRQVLNRRSGAVHAAAWADLSGTLMAVREDVGRHNALDKLLGWLARDGADPRAGFLLITSRCSFEMVQKAGMRGVAVLVAISAPTGMALRVAEQGGLTIVALARPDSMTVYAHPRRIRPLPPA